MLTLFLLAVLASPPDVTLSLAEDLAGLGNSEAAVTEYKRFICFSTDSLAIGDAYRSMSRVLRDAGDCPGAIVALRRSMLYTTSDSLRAELRIETGILLIASNQSSAAEIELLRVVTFCRFAACRHRALFFLGVCRLYRQDWQGARAAFAQAIDTAHESRRGIVDSLLAPANLPHMLSPNLAGWLSSILPGAGQFYCADWRNGANALVINSVTGYLLVSSILSGNIQDVLLPYVSLFQRYYWGNRTRAIEIARQENLTRNRVFQRRVLEALARTLD